MSQHVKTDKADANLVPLMSEHGGSYTEGYNPRQEVRTAAHVLGGSWVFRDLPDGSSMMTRTANKVEA